MTEPRQILVVGPSWVGDMVMAQALFMHLRAQYPDVAIDVVAPGWSLALLARMPEVRSGIRIDVGHGELRIGERRRLGRSLRDRGYDRAIVLPRSFKAALVPAFARIPQRTGFLGEYRYGLINDIRPFDSQQLNQTVKRFLALGGDELPDPIPEPRLQVHAERAAEILRQAGAHDHARRIIFAPGAEYGPAKRWPAEYFAELARRLADQDYQVIILGSSKEATLGASIEAETARPEVISLCGATELVDVVDLLGTASAAVCNDSGLLHVAAASGVPLVALYGSSTPAFTPPLTDRARVIYQALSCSPCFKRACPLGHLECLRSIDSDRVATELDEIMSPRAA